MNLFIKYICISSVLLRCLFEYSHADAQQLNDDTFYFFTDTPAYKIVYPFNVSDIVFERFNSSRGLVVTQKDTLTYKDGRDARFFGVGIRFTKQFPPNDPLINKNIASHLATVGFNHVRIVGFDFDSLGWYDYWKKNGQLPTDGMNRLCRFINEIRKKGIYYSISPNHNSSKYFEPGGKLKKHKGKGEQLINEEAIQSNIDWIKALMTYEGGECKNSFASDSLNLFLTAVNEDSLFHHFNKDFITFSEKTRRDMDIKFSKWLLTQYRNNNIWEKSWGNNSIIKDESINKLNVHVLGLSKLIGLSNRRKEDTVKFLIEIERNFYQRIKHAISNIGFKGLFLGSNYWNGYGSLAASNDVVDANELHIYFDRPRNRKKNNALLIKNISYIENHRSIAPNKWSYSYDPLFLAFSSSVDTKPLIISEWNHGAWSQYPYEGPLLITAYSSFQGYPIIDLHTYQERSSVFSDSLNKSGFSFNGNPVLFSIIPTLSLAFLRGDITQPKETYIYSISKSTNDFYQYIATEGNKLKNRKVLGLGFQKKIRASFDMRGDNSKINLKYKRKNLPQIINPLAWSQTKIKTFKINTSRFQAIAGNLIDKTSTNNMIIESGSVPGLLMAISLTDKSLSNSKDILVTAIADYRTEGLKIRDVGLFRRERHIQAHAIGSKKYLRKLGNRVKIIVNNSYKWTVYAHYPDGTKKIIPVIIDKSEDGKVAVMFNLSENTPWYMLHAVDN